MIDHSASMMESPRFVGRAVAAPAADPKVLAKTGRARHVTDIAGEYGFTDVDGVRPVSRRPRYGRPPMFGPEPGT